MLDKDYMRRAMALARKGAGRTSPNPMVGAVIVKGNRIIAEGWHRRCGADHAEIMALKKAGKSAAGARLYVTLEPCFHYGRTPPCVNAVIQSGIREVMIGMTDPNPLTSRKSIQTLRRAGVKVKVGILQKELTRLNEVFIKYISTGMPFVTVKCAQTLDGKIATASGDSKWITSQETRDFARRIRNQFDAILVGVQTVLRDDPCLCGSIKTRRFKKIILDSSLQTPAAAKLFQGLKPGDCIIAAADRPSPQKRAALSKKGAEITLCPRKADGIDLPWFFKELAKREVTNILIEGGARVIGSALREGIVDKMHIYFAPKIFGDARALSAVVGLNPVHVDDAVSLRDLTVEKIGKDIRVTAYVHRDR